MYISVSYTSDRQLQQSKFSTSNRIHSYVNYTSHFCEIYYENFVYTNRRQDLWNLEIEKTEALLIPVYFVHEISLSSVENPSCSKKIKSFCDQIVRKASKGRESSKQLVQQTWKVFQG